MTSTPTLRSSSEAQTRTELSCQPIPTLQVSRVQFNIICSSFYCCQVCILQWRVKCGTPALPGNPSLSTLSASLKTTSSPVTHTVPGETSDNADHDTDQSIDHDYDTDHNTDYDTDDDTDYDTDHNTDHDTSTTLPGLRVCRRR